MAETVHLTLLANGEQIEGDSTQTSLERENTIECLAFEQSGNVPVSETSVTGRRRYKPLRIVKRIDRATPLIARAFARNETITGTFRFYRAGGDGTTEHFFTIEVREGRVASVRQFVLGVLDADVADEPPQEEVTFVFSTISWRWEPTGIDHEDTWSTAR